MENLDQKRAKNALDAKIGKGSGDGKNIAKKVPVMIRENGFIAAMAFAKEKGQGYKDVFDSIIKHLDDVDQLHELPCNFECFLSGLCKKDSAVLRAVTAEAMAYLNYLRRFQG